MKTEFHINKNRKETSGAVHLYFENTFKKLQAESSELLKDMKSPFSSPALNQQIPGFKKGEIMVLGSGVGQSHINSRVMAMAREAGRDVVVVNIDNDTCMSKKNLEELLRNSKDCIMIIEDFDRTIINESKIGKILGKRKKWDNKRCKRIILSR